MSNDFDLKIRMNTIFWSLGYCTRLEVKLAEYSLQRKIPLELTDLDVLGIRILPDLSISFLVADCSTNKEVVKSPIQRVFWLKGVMDFFGSSSGYLTLGTINAISEPQRIVANRLGITILDETNTTNLEKRVESSRFQCLKLSARDSWLYFENGLTTLDKELAPLLNFRKHYYWMNPAHQNLHLAISFVTKLRKFLDKGNLFHKALLIDLLSLFSLSIIRMSLHVSRINPENPELELKSYFYGGYQEMRRREGIIENIRKILEGIPMQRSLFADTLKLDPEYLSNMFELAFRLLNKPFESSEILRYLQGVLFEKVLNGGKNEEGIKYLESGFSDITKKLARDIALFFQDTTHISDELIKDFF